MRILQISDTHLGQGMHAVGPAGWSRAKDHHRALEFALGPALREEVDLVLHCGDVFNRSAPPRRWMVKAGALFAEVARRVPVIGIAGNHDRRGIRRWLPHGQLGFTDQPMAVEYGGVRIGLVPFHRCAERFSHEVEALGPVDLLAIHQAPHGSRVGRFRFRVGVQADTVGAQHLHSNPWVACGHIHPRQAVRCGASMVVCGGSTERTAFSEADQVKGAVLWRFEAEVKWEFLDHPTRPMNQGRCALVRCTQAEVRAVRDQGQIAVLRGEHRVRRPVPQLQASLWPE